MWLSKVLFVSEVLADDYEISFMKVLLNIFAIVLKFLFVITIYVTIVYVLFKALQLCSMKSVQVYITT